MNCKPNINHWSPEKIRSACWLALALMLFLVSSFAESSWPEIGPDPDLTRSVVNVDQEKLRVVREVLKQSSL